MGRELFILALGAVLGFCDVTCREVHILIEFLYDFESLNSNL